jgi:hypothetical protein
MPGSELTDAMLELAELFDQKGSASERDRWPPYLRGLAGAVSSGHSVDLVQFHRQLSGGRGSMADNNIDGVWELVERIVALIRH